MLLSHVTSTGVSMLAPTASTVTSLPASEAQQFIAVGSSALPPMPPPARILSTSSPLILDTYTPARLMLRGQLDPEVLKLIPLRSVSLKMRMSPVPLSRRQTLDPDRTLASGKLSGSRCVLAAFHAHFTLEKSTVRVSGFASTTGSCADTPDTTKTPDTNPTTNPNPNTEPHRRNHPEPVHPITEPQSP